MNDLYAPCQCGSGKKFKWCCEPIYHEIKKAFEQAGEGQHETALKVMADLVAKHPQNPEAWGQARQPAGRREQAPPRRKHRSTKRSR